MWKEVSADDSIIKTMKDYRSGTVYLYKKELDHIYEHHDKDMPKNIPAIAEAIAQPEKVFEDKEHNNRQTFYKHCESATFSKRFFLKTVVQYGDKSLTDGYVVTAYPSAKVGTEGEKIYDVQDKESHL